MQLFTSYKEAVALIVVLENYIALYKDSATAEMICPVIQRIRICLEKQGKRRK